MDLSQRTAFFQWLLYVFWKFCFSLRTFYKELIWCTNDPNAHIRTFWERWSFIWRCFFPVSILNTSSKKRNENDKNTNFMMRNNKKSAVQRKYMKALCNMFYELTSLTRDVIKAHPLIKKLKVSKCITKKAAKGLLITFSTSYVPFSSILFRF